MATPVIFYRRLIGYSRSFPIRRLQPQKGGVKRYPFWALQERPCLTPASASTPDSFSIVTRCFSASGEVSRSNECPAGEEKKSRRRRRKLNKLSPSQQLYVQERAALVNLLRNEDTKGAFEWYSRVQENGLRLDEKLYSMLLSVLVNGGKLEDVDQVYRDMNDRGLSNEAAESLMIRAFCQQGLPSKAERIVESIRSRGEAVKARMLEPLLEAYCVHVENDTAAVDSVERVYSDLKRALVESCVDIEINTFSVLIDGLLRFKQLQPVRKEVEEAVKRLGEVVVADIGNHVRVGDELLQEKLDIWLEQSAGLKRRSCRVDWNGNCKSCGHQLHAKELAREVEMELVREAEELVSATEPKNVRDSVVKRWESFKRWLDKREQKLGDRGAYDCVIDVANVAYYHSNGLNSKLQFNYASVQCLVDHLEGRNKRCLLILHESHLGSKDCRTAHDRSILRNWKANDMVYFVPRGFLDDYFWLYAALVRGGQTLIVSNDWMRDHHFTLLKQTSFQRWREQHQVRFQLTWDGETRKLTEPIVHFPTPYTRHVQIEYKNDPTVSDKGRHRTKRGLYAPEYAIQSVHVPMSFKQVRRSEKGKQLPYIRDIPRHGDLSWACWQTPS